MTDTNVSPADVQKHFAKHSVKHFNPKLIESREELEELAQSLEDDSSHIAGRLLKKKPTDYENEEDFWDWKRRTEKALIWRRLAIYLIDAEFDRRNSESEDSDTEDSEDQEKTSAA